MKDALEAAIVLDNVLLPLLQISDANESTLRSSLYSTYAKKFASAVYCFFEQEGKRIQLLDLTPSIGTDIEWILADKDRINIVEKQALRWTSIIQDAIEVDLEMNRQTCNRPMDEVEFWRKRHIILSDLMEQIKGDHVHVALQVLRRSQSFVQSKLEERIRIVTKLQVEASDNANFLGTLERHIRTLQDAPIHIAIDSIPSLVDGMKMVWIVSRHYNRDERMFPLMQLVSKQIESRVRNAVNLKGLNENNIDTFHDNVKQSKALMQLWKSSYLKTRFSLENISGGHRRWEFDQALLFGNMDYMCTILEDLIEMIDVTLEFDPKVFRMSGNDDSIKVVIVQIQELTSTLVSIPFDIFLPGFNNEWVLTKKKFNTYVGNIEKAAEISIKHIFRQVLSSEKAFDLANKMRKMMTRESILKIVNERYIDILNQYERELDQLSLFFMANKKDIPICMKHQKFVGLAAWAHQLYLQAKRSILLLQQEDDMISSQRGKKVKKQYIQFAKDIDDFKTGIFYSWCSSVHQICQEGMSCSILRVRKKQLEVNFDDRFKSILIEARQFQALGFTVPPQLDDLVLQQDTLERYILEVGSVVKLYNSFISSLHFTRSFEKKIVESQLRVLEAMFCKGLTDLTWSSQRILPFLNTVRSKIGNISSIVTELKTKIQELDSKLKRFAGMNLIDLQTNDLENVSLSVIQDVDRRSEIAFKEYNDIIIQLNKITEKLVDQSIDLTEPIENMIAYYDAQLRNGLFEISLRSSITCFYLWNQTSPNNDKMIEKGFDSISFNLQKLQHWTPESSKMISNISSSISLLS